MSPSPRRAAPRRSLDAWVMTSPSRAFRYVASQPAGDGLWLAARRPLFLAGVLSCGVSLIASGMLTLRIVAPAAVYWAFVPLVELLALMAVIWSRRQRISLAAAIDTFFAGHGAWTLSLIGLSGMMAFLPPPLAYEVMTTLWLLVTALVIAWSACIDFYFFRWMCGASRAAAVRDVAVNRLLTWTAVFAIFTGATTPVTIVREIEEALTEVFRG
jgi:hypothetical protein